MSGTQQQQNDNLPTGQVYYALLRTDGSGRASRLIMFNRPPSDADIPSGAVALTADQYSEWSANYHTRAMVNGAFTTVPTDEVWEVSAFAVVNRISQAGKLRAALTELGIDAPMSALTDDQLALRERYNKATTFFSNDQQVRGLIEKVGLDPDVILAKE